MRRTKIVCTIGPASELAETIEQMIRAGMNVARLNFSHGTQEEHARKIAAIREIAARLGRPVAILQDLAGPKIRIGSFASGPIRLKPGEIFTLTARDVPGDAREVSVTYRGLPRDVQAGDTLLLADGAMEMKVERAQGHDIACRVVVGGELSAHKGINLPTRSIHAPILTEKDFADFAFGLGQGVDYAALSFVKHLLGQQNQLLVAKAFEAQPETWLPEAYAFPEGYVLAKAGKVTPPTDEEWAAEKELWLNSLNQRAEEQTMQAFVADLRAKADVRITNPGALEN